MEYVLSRTAIDAAEDSGAGSYAPGYWYKAEQYYSKAVKLYKLNSNNEARKHFIKARRYAEKAEIITRLKKFQSGEAGP